MFSSRDSFVIMTRIKLNWEVVAEVYEDVKKEVLCRVRLELFDVLAY